MTRTAKPPSLPPIPRIPLARLYRDLDRMQEHATRTPLFGDEVRWERAVTVGREREKVVA